MPTFIYSHPKTGEIREVIQSVHDDHTFTDENGLKWNREWTNPTYSISSLSKIDPHNPKQFTSVTGTKRGTLGDLQDLSAELSNKREKQMGRDPIKEKMYENYSKRHKNKLHPDLKKKQLKESLKKTMFEWSE